MKENIELRLKLANFFEGIGWNLEAFSLRHCGTEKKTLRALLRILGVNLKYAIANINTNGVVPDGDKHLEVLKELHDAVVRTEVSLDSMPEPYGLFPDNITVPKLKRYGDNPLGLLKDIKTAVRLAEVHR